MTDKTAQGKVLLVGGGPGDPGLLTLKGKRALESCDAVLYDYLVDPSLLDLAPPHVPRVYVGKSGAHKGADSRQARIIALLIERAHRGEVVVRLKGGDPFVFGRGGEEAAALRAANVPFEVVPGVSSAIAAPAYAGIPVTHRNTNTALAVVTGHQDPRLPEARTNWTALASFAASGGTLVILMGVKNLGRNMAFIMAEGVQKTTPAAMVRWGTRPDQEVLVGTVADIADKVAAADLGPPAVCVVGPAVALREQLDWFRPGPLMGRRVLVTRERAASEALAQDLRALGALPVILPALEIQPPKDPAPLTRAMHALAEGEYDWLALTSANGSRAFLAALFEAGLDARALAGVSMACVGQVTARTLFEGGLRADLLPEKATASALADALIERGVDGARVLAPLASAARDTLPNKLRAAGARVDVVEAYQTGMPDTAPEVALRTLREGRVDAAIFASPSALRHLSLQVAPASLDAVLSGAVVACIGPVTAKAAESLGVRVDVVPQIHTLAETVRALAACFIEKEAHRGKEESQEEPQAPKVIL